MTVNRHLIQPDLKAGCCLLWYVLLGVLITGCLDSNYITRPDVRRFEKAVPSRVLRDSLQAGKLVNGMPYFVAGSIFSKWEDRRKRPVASVGSRQELQEMEGWNRRYVDPNHRVFVDEYDTKSGTLCIWYQYPDFFRMEVSARDTLVVTTPDRTFSSVIECIRDANTLTVEKRLDGPTDEDTLYAEIHYREMPHRASNESYWYLVKVLSDGKTFTLRPPSFDYYPIEWIELNNTPVSSFNWKELP